MDLGSRIRRTGVLGIWDPGSPSNIEPLSHSSREQRAERLTSSLTSLQTSAFSLQPSALQAFKVGVTVMCSV